MRRNPYFSGILSAILEKKAKLVDELRRNPYFIGILSAMILKILKALEEFESQSLF